MSEAFEIPDRREHELSRLRERAFEYANNIFHGLATGEERVQKLKENLSHFFGNIEGLDQQTIEDGIQQLASLNDEAAFAGKMIETIEPILAFQVDHPDVMRKLFVERHDFVPLNDVLSYGITEDGYVVHIHLAPATDVPNLLSEVTGGLRELASRIKRNPEAFQQLDRISASSWIVAEHPKIMERLGFTIDGPSGEDAQARAQAAGETRPSSRSHIDLQDFLARYGT